MANVESTAISWPGAAFTVELPLSSVHPDWLADWATNLPVSSGTFEALRTSSRLESRLVGKIAGRLGLPALGPDDLQGAARVVFDALSVNPVELVVLVGLGVHSHAIARTINSAAVRGMAQNFDLDLLRLALKLRPYAAAGDGVEIELSQLPRIAEASGQRILAIWSATLPRALRGRVLMTLPKRIGLQTTNLPGGNQSEASLVKHAASFLMSQHAVVEVDFNEHRRSQRIHGTHFEAPTDVGASVIGLQSARNATALRRSLR